jgi:cytochrome d ubiquinol oxidase subunit I
MDVLTLSRLQFALTISFHYLFPPISIGLSLLLVTMEGLYLKTGNPLYHQMTRFWTRVFGLIFALGVATGIVMEFQFGTNWAVYSKYVGDVFGSALAAEGIFAFFLESGFLAVLLFGWNRVSPRMHFFSTVMVMIGAHFSAVWIIVANSWQQTPAGHHIVMAGLNARAEIVDFWQLVFNPSTLDRISHSYMGAWQAGAFLVLSISAFYIIKSKHHDFAKAGIKIALILAAAASLLQLVTGHSSARTVSQTQPAKLAAFEAHYPASSPAPLYLMGWVDEDKEQVDAGIKIPGLLSFLVYGDAQKPLTGLSAFPPDKRPPVNAVFQAYHAMVAIGMGLILISLAGLFFWLRGTLFRKKWYLWILVFSVIGPQLANQLGWFSAEVGRQPYIVYNLLLTSDAVSKTITAGQVITSLILFGIVYILLFGVYIYLLNETINHGPSDEEAAIEGHRA